MGMDAMPTKRQTNFILTCGGGIFNYMSSHGMISACGACGGHNAKQNTSKLSGHMIQICKEK